MWSMGHDTNPSLLTGLRLRTALRFAFTVFVVVSIGSLFAPNYYRSECKLLPGDAKGGNGSLGGLATAAAALGVSVPGGDGGEANFVDILNSRKIKEELLYTNYIFKQKKWVYGDETEIRSSLIRYLGSKNLDRAMDQLGTIYSVSRDLKTKIITITAETKSPLLSQLIVNRAEDLLEKYVQEKGRTRAGAKVLFTQARLVEARKELEGSEAILRSFLEKNKNFQSSGDPSVRLLGLRLEGEFRLHQQLVGVLSLNCEQAMLDERNDIPILNVLDSGWLPIEKSKPSRLQFSVMVSLISLLSVCAIDNRKIIISLLNTTN